MPAGLPIVFKDGKPWTLQSSNISVVKWHAQEIVIYAHVLVHLSSMFGSQIPDSEFVVMVNDQPGPVKDQLKEWPPVPLFR
jgi:hypothetical protein